MPAQSRCAVLVLALVFILEAGMASSAAAQWLPPLLGSRARIQVDGAPQFSGVVVGQTADSLTLQVAGDMPGRSFPLAHVRRVERYAPRRSFALALAGFVAGGAVGYVVGGYEMNRGIARCEATPGHGDLCGLDPVTLPLFTLGGVVLGALGGGLVKLPHWERVF